MIDTAKLVPGGHGPLPNSGASCDGKKPGTNGIAFNDSTRAVCCQPWQRSNGCADGRHRRLARRHVISMLGWLRTRSVGLSSSSDSPRP